MEQQKMMKIARGLDITVRVIFTIAIIASIMLIFAGSILLANHYTGNLLGMAEEHLQIKIFINRKEAIAPDATTLGFAIFVGLTGLIGSIYCRKQMRRVLNTMQHGRPFEEGNSLILRKQAIFFIVAGTIFQVVSFAYYGIFVHGVQEVVDANTVITYDFSYLFIAAVLFLLSYIFKYGEILQTESDETL